MLEFHQLPSSEEVLQFLTGSVTKQGFKGLQETVTKNICSFVRVKTTILSMPQ